MSTVRQHLSLLISVTAALMALLALIGFWRYAADMGNAMDQQREQSYLACLKSNREIADMAITSGKDRLVSLPTCYRR